jgi:hypothetical protein
LVRGRRQGTFEGIKELIEKALRDLYGNREVSLDDIRNVCSAVIEERLEYVEQSSALTHVTEAEVTELGRRYSECIRVAREERLQHLPLTRKAQSNLRRIATLMFARKTFTPLSSGVVIAGYGDQEHFPRLDHLIIESIVNDRVNYDRDHQAVINHTNGAYIRAFAQKEMVVSFMEGVNSNYQHVVTQLIGEVLHQYPKIVVDNIPRISEKRRADIKSSLEAISDEVTGRLLETLERVRRENYAEPIINVVAVLPKDELAGMAEALVNLTAVRRKLSFRVETVGGPIDVAVISKGDGFVWLKRKNYFNLATNPHFVARYLR